MLFCVLNALSQSTLSSADIYNYDVGDVFHYVNVTSNTTGGDHTYKYYNKVITKTVGTNFVTYQFHRFTIEQYSGSSITDPAYTDSITTYPSVTYSLLDTYADTSLCSPNALGFDSMCLSNGGTGNQFPLGFNPVTINCLSFDTIGYDNVFSSRKYYISSQLSSLCLKTTGEQFKYVEGLGRTSYLTLNHFSGNQGYQEVENLVYYKKASGETWGTPLPLSIKDDKMSYLESLKLYPNPANDLIKIQGSNAKKDISIYNQMGQAVFAKQEISNTVQIDISNWADGHYYVQVKSNDQINHLKFVKN